MKNTIRLIWRMIVMACAFELVLSAIGFDSYAAAPLQYTNHVIFTAPSAEKIFDGTPLTEQIDVTAQGLPKGFTYKAVAEGSVTYPEDNSEDNNIVTDYIIYDPSGLNVTDRFVNVETRPGTLRVSYADASVLGAQRGEIAYRHDRIKVDGNKAVTNIEDEDTPLSAAPALNKQENVMYGLSLETMIYVILVGILMIVFAVFLVDSNRLRAK